MKRGKRILNVSTALILCGVSVFAGYLFTGAIHEEKVEAAEKDVTKYTYSVQPLLAPFNNLIYVKTDNPDPFSFRLTDKNSHYISNPSDDIAGAYEVLDNLYLDVIYEKESAYRVKGGYVFYNYLCDADGGSLTLQYKEGYGDWKDTSKKISCPTVKDKIDYIIDKYTKDKNDFFEKLDAAQNALDQLAVYPRDIYDTSKTGYATYPFLSTSPYRDVSLVPHYNIYQLSDRWSLLSALYPFVLDSKSFPNRMIGIAKRINSNCTYEWDETYHDTVRITLDGKRRSYGGQGTGSSTFDIYNSQVKKDFLFDGSTADLGLNGTVDKLENRYLEYTKIGEENTKKYAGLLYGDTFDEKIGPGNWIRVATDANGYGRTYSYFSHAAGDGTSLLYSTWVDGRYINDNFELEPGAKFSDHPKSAIIIRNMEYTDKEGNKHQNDVRFVYNAEMGCWWAKDYYTSGIIYAGNIVVPEELILTRQQVEALKPDRNTNSIPESGLVYDGSGYPGTPFINKIVKSISIQKIDALKKGESKKLSLSFNPADATEKRVTWKSDNTNVATVDEEGNVKAVNHGKAKITATSVDGARKASITVYVNAVKVTGVKLDKTKANETVGNTLQLNAAVSPTNATNKSVTWSSSNTAVATVDSKGKVTAKKAGTAKITVKTKDGGKTAVCTVTVKAKAVQPSSVKIAQKTYILNKGATKTVTATVAPANAGNKKVTWSSSNTKVATVDSNGKVKAVNHGTAKITAKTSNGKTASCEVRVNFIDVKDTKSWYYKAVYWGYEKGIVTGSGGYFQPGKNCTREQAITMLWRLAGKPELKSMNSKFSDVKDTKRYSYKAIMWGNERGLIFGTKGKFNPTGTCTREQIVTMLWRWAGRPEPKTTASKFSDVKNKNSYSYKAILWANEKGIAKGSNGRFSPTLNCKRRDIVTFIYRYKN